VEKLMKMHACRGNPLITTRNGRRTRFLKHEPGFLAPTVPKRSCGDTAGRRFRSILD
jgi:hypothetical protein